MVKQALPAPMSPAVTTPRPDSDGLQPGGVRLAALLPSASAWRPDAAGPHPYQSLRSPEPGRPPQAGPLPPMSYGGPQYLPPEGASRPGDMVRIMRRTGLRCRAREVGGLG